MERGEEAEVSFRSGGERVFATLRRGRGRGRRPVAVLVHGFGAFRDELTGFSELAEKLAAAGVTSLRPDMRGCGKSGARGQMRPMWDWVEDVDAAISWLQGQPDAHPERIAAIGMSMGGGVVSAAAAFDRRINVVVALAPVTDGEGWLRHLWTTSRSEKAWRKFCKDVSRDSVRRTRKGRSKMVAVPDLLAFGEADHSNFLKMARKYPAFLRRASLSAAESVMRANIAPLAAMIAPRPLLVVHSKADTVVPFAQGEALAAAGGEKAELLAIDNSPHCFWIAEDSERVQSACVDWLGKWL
jgi:hypothetical protein